MRPREFFTSRLISFLPGQLLLCGIGLWQSGRWGKPGGPPRGTEPPQHASGRRKPQPEADPPGFCCGGCQGKWPADSLCRSWALPIADRSRAAIMHRLSGNGSGSIREQPSGCCVTGATPPMFRSVEPSFRSTTAEACATIKLRTGAMG
jgi:hypothetical protein